MSRGSLAPVRGSVVALVVLALVASLFGQACARSPEQQPRLWKEVVVRASQVEVSLPAADPMVSGSGPVVGSSSYVYNADGATKTRTVNGVVTSFAYDAQGLLVSTTGPAGTSTYVRDAAGEVLLRVDPDATTLYLPMQDVKRTAAGVVTTTKNYSFNGTSVGVRAGVGNVQYVLSDLHGSNQVAVNPALRS